MWHEPARSAFLVSHQRPVINDLRLEAGCKQQPCQPALLWDNLHPTAIFSTKHPPTGLILHYKLGLPDALGSACGQNQEPPSDAHWRAGQCVSRNDTDAAWGEKKGKNTGVIVFNIHSKSFIIDLCKYFQRAKSRRGARQMNCCNQYEFTSFPPRLSFLIACRSCP